jgi:uncharacterized protein (DUF362 family)
MGSHRSGTTRRNFLKTTAAAGLALGLPGRPVLANAATDYDLVVIQGDPAAATRKALEAMGGISRFVQKGQRVVLKPNMSFATPPERASTTHPLVVVTVAQACMDAGAERVMVLDFPLQRTEQCLERSGIQDACKSIRGVHVLGLDDRKFFREVKIPQGKVIDRVEVLKDVLDSHVLINLPQAKSHSTTGVSLGIKNLMGLIWNRWTFHTLVNINYALADLVTVVRPQLTLLDATRALVTGGPGGPGEVQRPNLIIAGTDPVAVDSYGVTVAPWYGKQFKARQVEHVLVAHQRGLGKIDLDQLKILKERA